jgi:hypothetical protein
MKKRQNIFLRGFFLLIFTAGVFIVSAQVPAYQCELKNDSLLTSQVYEFEIWLKNTSAIPFELGNFQAGIMLNSLILNGGSPGAEIIAGSSQLNYSQQPSSVAFSLQDNCLKIAPKLPPVFSEGTLISGTGEGTRICRIRLTNSIPFATAKPNLTFNFSVFPYNSVVSAFDRTTHLNMGITNPGNHLVSGLANPLLNGTVSVFAVSGSGSYCQGSPGLPVSLGSSQAEIMYQLKKNGISDGGEIAGNGSGLIWTDRSEGTYTVKGRRQATYLSDDMTGSAVIVADVQTAGGVVTGGTTISPGSSTDTLRLQGQSGDIISWQKQVDGGGFTGIPSTAGLTFFMETPATTGNWEYRAVIKSGSCPQEYSAPAVVVVTAEPITRSWTGLVDEKWNKSGNWSPAGVPGVTDDVIIPATAPSMPVVHVNGLGCDDVLVKAGALLIIQPGFILTVNGTMIIEE